LAVLEVLAGTLARWDPGRKVQDRRSTVDRARDRNRVEQIELRRRRGVDLVTLRSKEWNRRPAEDTASAGHQETQTAPLPTDVSNRRYGPGGRSSQSRSCADAGLTAPQIREFYSNAKSDDPSQRKERMHKELPEGWSWSVHKQEQGRMPFSVTLSRGSQMIFGHEDM
jgi:hypothetical protein